MMFRTLVSIITMAILLTGVEGTAAEQTASSKQGQTEYSDSSPAQKEQKTSGQTARERAQALLAQMTLEEKIDYIGGYEHFYIRGIERLGIPQIVMADGPVGCRNYGQTTAYPATFGLAAAWNPQLAGEFGTAIGRDCRARGVHILLMPGVNLYRSPLCGRNFEYMGEDPYLISETAVSIVKALQKQGVMATVKHFAANNQEYDRHNVSSDIDERTLHEMYLSAFRAVVQKGGVKAVMTAYNPVNGIHCSQHDELIRTILKGQWGFDGFVMSDWGSTYDGVAAANAGLDLEMPSGKFMNRQTLIPAVRDGRVSREVIDDKVLRILRTLIEMGFFDRAQKDAAIPLDDPTSGAVALEMARQGIVLLKNENHVLPLDETRIQSIAVIGPNATLKNNAYGGGGSSFTQPFKVINLVDAVKTLADGRFEVLTAQDFENIPLTFEWQNIEILDGGFQCDLYEYQHEYRQADPVGMKPLLQRRYPEVNFSAKEKNFEYSDKPYFAAWKGAIKANADGIYRLHTEVYGELRYFLLDDERIVNSTGKDRADLYLEKDRVYKVSFCSIVTPSQKDRWVFRLGCQYVASLDEYMQTESIKKADAVVVCVGFNPRDNYEGEGADRSYELPSLQVRLIRTAAALNKKTIVAATAGGGFATADWIGDVPAFLHNGYPGQNGTVALAEILFGRTNPSGKLPITFEKRLEDCPTYQSYHDTDGDKRLPYTEGLFVGYRGFEKNNTEPLFCFGHGLSYTQFEYGQLKLSSSDVTVGSPVTISAEIENVGSRRGAETAQLYIGHVRSRVPRPLRELKGFSKITLDAGEKKTVVFTVDPEQLRYYDIRQKQWVLEPGEYRFWVGGSLRQTPLTGAFTLSGR